MTCKRPHPLPASPIKGEVQFSGWGSIVPHEWSETSPLMGEVGGGGVAGSKRANLAVVSLPIVAKG